MKKIVILLILVLPVLAAKKDKVDTIPKTNGSYWYFTHDNDTIIGHISFIKSGTTYSKHFIEAYKTYDSCLMRINELGLKCNFYLLDDTTETNRIYDSLNLGYLKTYKDSMKIKYKDKDK